jgi:hypothetical protein
MAVLLYPHTKNTAVIEKLLGVSKGTSLRHTAINEQFKLAKAVLKERFAECSPKEQAKQWKEYYRLDKAEWDAYNISEEIAKYDEFLTFGWGRVVSRLCKGNSGFTDNPVKVAQILRVQGVTLPPDVNIKDLEGLEWR